MLQLEGEIKEKVTHRGARDSDNRRLKKISGRGRANEPVETATLSQSLDGSVAIYLLSFANLSDKNVVPDTRELIEARNQGLSDGGFKLLTVLLYGGSLNPQGNANDFDGTAPITNCAPFIPQG